MDRAITLAVLAWRIARTTEAENALQKLKNTTSDVARILGQHTAEIRDLAFSGDSSVLATAAWDGSIVLWRVSDWRPTGTVVPGERDMRYVALDWIPCIGASAGKKCRARS
jgi:WD40 repeat protein